MLWMLLGACLINEDLYQENLDRLSDVDQDGYDLDEDCNDADATVHPGATEQCNGIDDDCDGNTDEDAPDAPTWYLDADFDGYGSADHPVKACTAPEGYLEDATDCDDSLGDVNPGAEEIPYDALDNDCQGGDLVDVDGDGYAAEAAEGTDCDDGDPEVHPGAEEGWEDHLEDNDCDGILYEAAQWQANDHAPLLVGPVAGGQLGRRMAFSEERSCLALTASFDTEYRGRILFEESGSGLSRTAGSSGVLHGPRPSAFFGGDLAFSADGILATSTVLAEEGTGEVWLLHADQTCGSGEVTADSADGLIIAGRSENSYFGSELAWLDDIDGDGLQELAMSATHESVDDVNETGAIYIWLSPDIANPLTSAGDADVVVWGSAEAHLRKARTAASSAGSGLPTVLFTQDSDGVGGPSVFSIQAEDVTTGPAADLATAVVVADHSGSTMLTISPGWDVPGDRVVAGVVQVAAWHVDELVGTLEVASAEVQVSTGDETPIWDITSLGDLDDDGQDELLVQNLSQPTADKATGTATLLLGKDIPFTGSVEASGQLLTAVGDEVDDRFAYSALPVLDFDDDGIIDIAIAAVGHSEAGTEAGSVYLVPSPFQ